jgi:hypothetical protein
MPSWSQPQGRPSSDASLFYHGQPDLVRFFSVEGAAPGAARGGSTGDLDAGDNAAIAGTRACRPGS